LSTPKLRTHLLGLNSFIAVQTVVFWVF